MRMTTCWRIQIFEEKNQLQISKQTSKQTNWKKTSKSYTFALAVYKYVHN